MSTDHPIAAQAEHARTITLDANNVQTTERCVLTGRTFWADEIIATLAGVGYVDRALLIDPGLDPAALLRARAAELRQEAAHLEAIAEAGVTIDRTPPEDLCAADEVDP